MKKTKWLVYAVPAVLAAGSMAWAGEQSVAPVVIRTLCPGSAWCSPGLNFGLAAGALGSARKSADAHQRIGCSVSYGMNGSPPLAVCQVVDETHKFVSCQSSNPDFIAGVRALTSDSYLAFTWKWNSNQPTGDTCYSIEVLTDSSTEPK